LLKRRDGEENAALAILAGYAHARQLPVDIFQQMDTRAVADVISRRQRFSSLDQLVPLLKAIADEQQTAARWRATVGARSVQPDRLAASSGAWD
jgi:hypothetical protein